ncbi:MAG: YciI family protein [Sphingomicrobium sp.]
MLFAWMGFLKRDAEPIPQSVQQQTTDFLSQPYIDIEYVGQLRDGSGQRAGMMMIFEVADRAAAEAFVEGSPYLDAGLYEDHRLYEYRTEVG